MVIFKMSDKVTIELNGIPASTYGDIWDSEDESIKTILNSIASKEDIEQYTPSYAYSMAKIAEDKLGAKIIEFIEDSVYDGQKIY